MDSFCATSPFPILNWNWNKNSPTVHIYFYDMWEDNFIPRIYEICDVFLRSMSNKNFKDDAPTFSQRARELILVHGDWYGREYLSYMRIWGSNTVHLLPRIIPDRMVLQEFAFQMVIDGVFPKLTKHKKKAWPKFPLNLDSLVL